MSMLWEPRSIYARLCVCYSLRDNTRVDSLNPPRNGNDVFGSACLTVALLRTKQCTRLQLQPVRICAQSKSVTATSLATKHILYFAFPTVLSHPQEQWTHVTRFRLNTFRLCYFKSKRASPDVYLDDSDESILRMDSDIMRSIDGGKHKQQAKKEKTAR